MLRPAGTPTPIESSSPQQMVETINEALVKGLPATAHSCPGLRLSWATKRVLDATIALTALCLLLPLLLFIALLIWGSDGRSPIFRHTRLGRYGRPFGCLKFRSMVPNGDAVLAQHLAANAQARAEWEATYKLTHDPRVTALGHVLRRTSLDELPQLWNVLRGEMSLVGPRPIRPAFFAELSRDIPQYWQRLVVRPGVTGLAQLRLTREMTWAEKLAHDLEYIADRSVNLYLSVIATTVWLIVVRPANRRATLNRLP